MRTTVSVGRASPFLLAHEAIAEEEEARRDRRGEQAVGRAVEMIIWFLSGGGERASETQRQRAGEVRRGRAWRRERGRSKDESERGRSRGDEETRWPGQSRARSVGGGAAPLLLRMLRKSVGDDVKPAGKARMGWPWLPSSLRSKSLEDTSYYVIQILQDLYSRI